MANPHNMNRFRIWRLLVGLGLPLLAGCLPGPDSAGLDQASASEQLGEFVAAFARQILAALVL